MNQKEICEAIVDCGRYGYVYNGDIYEIYEWVLGDWYYVVAFDCEEEQARAFCERYEGYGMNELCEELCIY